ncbi:MAG: MBL fold metallo-hydrolase [Phycisphaerales bacterium]|nr:MBL fold metallo-hydrolase [Phycisphaerales bacterium]
MNTNHQPTIMSRRDALRVLAVASGSAAFASPALALIFGSTANQDTLLKWYQLKPNHYAFVDLNTGGNALIHITDNAVVMIDTKYPHFAGAMKADAATVSKSDAPEITLINTHHHGDHTAGNAIIIPTAVASYAHKNAIPRIQSQLDTFKTTGSAASERIKGFSDSKALADLAKQAASKAESWTNEDITPKNPIDTQTTDLTIDGSNITLHHFGAGHTDNDLVVHFKDDNLIHTGDLVFNGLHPYFDPPAGVTALGWLLALNSTYNLCDESTTVVPGHGEPSDRTIIANQMNYITSIITNVQAEIKKDTPKEDILNMEWDFMKDLGFGSIRERAISAVYDELKG